MADKPKSPAAPPRKRQVVIIADFPDPWNNNDAAEVKAMLASTADKPAWSPSVKEFEAVMRADVINVTEGANPNDVPVNKCKDFGSFANIIRSFPVGSLVRVSLITHSSGDRIGLGGTVDKQGGVFFTGMDDGQPFTKSAMLASQTITSTVFDKLNQHLDTNVLKPDPEQEGTSLRDDLRSRFDPQQGEIIIYGCHSGGGPLSTNLQILLTRTLGVSVRSFKGFIEYVEIPADISLNPPKVKRRDKTRYQTGVEPKNRTVPFKPGFLHLIPDSGQGRPSSLVP